MRTFVIFLVIFTAPLPSFAQCCSWPPANHMLVDDMWLPIDSVIGDGVYTAVPWTNGDVPYRFHTDVTTAQRNLVREAMAEIEAVSQVRFLVYTNQANRIQFRENPSGVNTSNSAVGMIGGEQIINIGANHWDSKYVLVHEMMHALGSLHEQSRPDRDTYVSINWSRIESGREHNFQIDSGSTAVGPYDFLSIMHYRSTAFSVNGLNTITCNAAYSQFQNQIGNRTYMTQGDASSIATRYGGPSIPTISSVFPTSVIAGGASDVFITVTGTRFLEGSPNENGIQGTVVRLDLVDLETFFIDATTLGAIIPASLLQVPDPVVSIKVRNVSDAGGLSATSANFAIDPIPCSSAGDEVGRSVAGVGDVDGDGASDYVVGSPGINGRGQAWCVSGATSQILWSLEGGAGYFLGHAVACLGDTTGDGISEILVGAPGYSSSTGLVRVMNGANGGIVRNLFGSTLGTGVQFGYSVSTAGDVNGDGVPDILVGIPGLGVGGGARVYSGSTGGLIWALTETLSSGRFGHSVAGGVDVTGDGVSDFVVGAPNIDVLGVGTDAGQISIYNGATGNRTNRTGDGAFDYFGTSVAMVPSFLGGSIGFIVAGAPDNGSVLGSGAGAGYVRVFRGFQTFNPYPTHATYSAIQVGTHFGASVADAGDIDQDGVTDVAVGAPQGGTAGQGAVGPGFVQIRSGATSSVLWEKSGSANGEYFGWSVSGAGDTHRDGALDILAGLPFADVPCGNAGGFRVVQPPVPPALNKVMITEVTTGLPIAVELTNFDSVSKNISGWSVIIRGTSSIPTVATIPSLTLQPGEIAVLTQSGFTISEVPAGTQVLALISSLLGATTNSLVVGLRTSTGIVIDEVRCAGVGGQDPGTTTGGQFRGFARNLQPGAFLALSVSHERIWGLDSNGGEDWTSRAPRSLGLENSNAGDLGYDPLPKRRVLINEVDDNPDYVELRNVASGFLALPTDLAGWTLHASGQQGQTHVRLKLSSVPLVLQPGGFLVLGDASGPPSEIPAGVAYVDLASVPGGGFLPMFGDEYSLALHDHHGRPIDVVRTSGTDDAVVHNHPRSLVRWRDFQGAAPRDGSGSGAIGRNILGTDTDTADDWTPLAIRTMGAPNGGGPFTFYPSGDPGLDVRLNATTRGLGITTILNAGPEHAGHTWSFLFDVGHASGQGPIFGLGPNAIANYLVISTTPPFFGTLDAWGTARYDFPTGTLPPGIDIDAIYIVLDPFSVLAEASPIVEFDT